MEKGITFYIIETGLNLNIYLNEIIFSTHKMAEFITMNYTYSHDITVAYLKVSVANFQYIIMKHIYLSQ